MNVSRHHYILQHSATHCTIATYCNTLQLTATHFNLLQHMIATVVEEINMLCRHCTLQHSATLLQITATHMQLTATPCNKCLPVWWRRFMCCVVATCCNTLQHTATHCNTLQHTATHCSTCLPVWWRRLICCIIATYMSTLQLT